MILDDKTILVARRDPGSFGRKFVQIALSRYKPRRVIVFSRDELKQHEMSIQFADPRLRFFLGDVRDRDRLHLGVRGIRGYRRTRRRPQAGRRREYNPFEA